MHPLYAGGADPHQHIELAAEHFALDDLRHRAQRLQYIGPAHAVVAVDEDQRIDPGIRPAPFAHANGVALDRAVALQAFDALAHGIARQVDLGRQLGMGRPGIAGQLGDDAFVQWIQDPLHEASFAVPITVPSGSAVRRQNHPPPVPATAPWKAPRLAVVPAREYPASPATEPTWPARSPPG